MISPSIPIVTVGKDGRQYRKVSAVSRKLKKASSCLTENSAWLFPIMDELPDPTQTTPATDAFLLERPMTPFVTLHSATLRQDYNNFRISPTPSAEGKNARRVRFKQAAGSSHCRSPAWVCRSARSVPRPAGRFTPRRRDPSRAGVRPVRRPIAPLTPGPIRARRPCPRPLSARTSHLTQDARARHK